MVADRDEACYLMDPLVTLNTTFILKKQCVFEEKHYVGTVVTYLFEKNRAEMNAAHKFVALDIFLFSALKIFMNEICHESFISMRNKTQNE